MTIRRVTAALTVATGIAVAGGSAVYAPPAQALVCANCSNLVTQLLQQSQEITAYAKQVQQYKTQLDQLNLQIQQVANEGRNLTSLPRNVFGEYQQVYNSYKQSINQLRGSMANLENTRDTFAQRYPQVTNDATFQQLSAMVDQWQSQGRNNVGGPPYTAARPFWTPWTAATSSSRRWARLRNLLQVHSRQRRPATKSTCWSVRK